MYPQTRQAVVTMWSAGDLPHAIARDHADLPCTLALQFILRDRKLHCIATMRSNDAWLGLPYDVFAFTCLQRLVAQAVGAELGTYTHQVGSMHLYDRNRDRALEAASYWNGERPLPHETRWAAPGRTVSDLRGMCSKATAREEAVRRGVAPELADLDPMLSDLVLACAKHWNLSEAAFISEAMKEVSDANHRRS